MKVSKTGEWETGFGEKVGQGGEKAAGKFKIKWMQIIPKFNTNSTNGRQKLYAEQKYVQY